MPNEMLALLIRIRRWVAHYIIMSEKLSRLGKNPEGNWDK